MDRYSILQIKKIMIGYGNVNTDALNKYRENHRTWTDDLWEKYFYHRQNDINLYSTKKENKNCVLDPLKKDKDFKLMNNTIDRLNNIGQKINVFYYDNTAAVIGYNTLRFVVPSEFVVVEELKNYDEIDQEEIKRLSSGSHNSPVLIGNGSKSSIQKKRDEAERALDLMKEKEKEIQSEQARELSDLKAQMDALQKQMEERKKSLMEKLDKQKEEIEKKVKEFEKQLFMLETQIYGIRCYLGEVVHFYTIRNGTPADINDPIVVFQKLRYLDEEMGRYVSLFQFGNNDCYKENFLEVLKNREDIVSILAPAEKGISVVKLSRTGKVKAASSAFDNMLEDYEMLHENQLAILIRNGEQLHIAWLDADKINYSNDNVFLTPKKLETESYNEPQGYWETKSDELKRNKEKKEMISRWFFFNVLQGVLDNTSLISVPEKGNIMNNSYIVFNNADGWIDVNFYGSFADMIKRSEHIPMQKGDYVLTGMHITKESYLGNGSWDNTRGIGTKNRTSGVSLPQRKILPVNKVIPGLIVKCSAKIKKAKIVCNPKGQAWYRQDGGSLSTWTISDHATLDHYEPTYKVKYSDKLYEEKIWNESIDADKWYHYEHSYKKLTKEQLIKFSSNHYQNCFIYKNRPNGESYEAFSFSKKQAYKDNVDVFYYDIYDAEIIGTENHQYYISVEENGYDYYGHKTRYWVNFQFYPSEVIPLTFLCSTWIKEVIRTGNIGDYSLCSARMSFSDMLPYLHIILEHLREREKIEKAIITESVFLSNKDAADKWFNNHPNWDIKLVEWKIRKNYHKLTRTRAKAFVKEEYNANP